MANQELGATADGWEFRLVENQLSITSQSDPAQKIQLSPPATFVLLTYLSQYRDELYWRTEQQRDEPEPDSRPQFSDIEQTE